MASEKIRVLVAENSPGEAATALRAAYGAGEGRMELTDVGSVSTLLPTVSMVNPDVILLDLALAGPDPVNLVRRLHRSAPQVPLIILADAADKAEASRCLEVGAIDCLVKGLLDAQVMERAVGAALQRNALEGLADLKRDPLTNLYTRDGLMTLGTRAMETARRNGGTLVLLCALLENLTSMRENLGSKNTEQAVKELGELLRASFRRTDAVARWGEAQFAALAVDAAEPSAPVLRQRVQRRLDTFNQLRDAAGGMQARMAVGFWSPDRERTFGELMDNVEGELRSEGAVAMKEGQKPVNATGR